MNSGTPIAMASPISESMACCGRRFYQKVAATSITRSRYPVGERLRVFLPRDPARDDVTIEVQTTGNWAGPQITIAPSVLGAPFAGPGHVSGDSPTLGVKPVEIRDTVNTTAASQRFLRVRR